jgi:hypothetical protein
VFPKLQEALQECRSLDTALSPVLSHLAVNNSAWFSSIQGENKLHDRTESCFTSASQINSNRHDKTPVIPTVHAPRDMFQSCNDGPMQQAAGFQSQTDRTLVDQTVNNSNSVDSLQQQRCAVHDRYYH